MGAIKAIGEAVKRVATEVVEIIAAAMVIQAVGTSVAALQIAVKTVVIRKIELEVFTGN